MPIRISKSHKGSPRTFCAAAERPRLWLPCVSMIGKAETRLPRLDAAEVYCGAPTPVSVAFSDEPSGSVTEPPLADNEPSRAR